jgi:hypothetical protein
MERAAFNQNKALFTIKLDLNLNKNLDKYHIWSVAMCGDETWTVRKVDRKYLERSEM